MPRARVESHSKKHANDFDSKFENEDRKKYVTVGVGEGNDGLVVRIYILKFDTIE